MQAAKTGQEVLLKQRNFIMFEKNMSHSLRLDDVNMEAMNYGTTQYYQNGWTATKIGGASTKMLRLVLEFLFYFYLFWIKVNP